MSARARAKREHLVSVIIIDGDPFDMWPNTFVKAVLNGGYEDWRPNFVGAYCPYPRVYSSSRWFRVLR